MRLKDFSLLIIFTLLSLPVAAQHQISGYVTEEQTDEPIEGVAIYDNAAGKSYYTNEKGYFEINDLSYGNYNLFFLSSDMRS